MIKIWHHNPQIEKTDIKGELIQSVRDFRDNLLLYKDAIGPIGLIVAITALFASIQTSDVYLKRAQAFLLIVSVCTLAYLIMSALRVFFLKSASELYYGFASFFLIGLGLFVFNLYAYIGSAFHDELLYFASHLGIAVITIVINILCIYFFRFLKKFYPEVDGWQLQTYFLVVLNLNLLLGYAATGYDPIHTLVNFSKPSFNNLLIPYWFLLAVFSEIRSFKGRSRSYVITDTVFYMTLVVAPFLLNFLVTF